MAQAASEQAAVAGRLAEALLRGPACVPEAEALFPGCCWLSLGLPWRHLLLQYCNILDRQGWTCRLGRLAASWSRLHPQGAGLLRVGEAVAAAQREGRELPCDVSIALDQAPATSLLVCASIPGAGPAFAGALVLGWPADLPPERRALAVASLRALASALAQHADALQEATQGVASILWTAPAPPAPAALSDGSAGELSDSDAEGGSWPSDVSSGGGAGLAPAAEHRSAELAPQLSHHTRRDLRFKDKLWERSFAEHYAQAMYRIDRLGMIIHGLAAIVLYNMPPPPEPGGWLVLPAIALMASCFSTWYIRNREAVLMTLLALALCAMQAQGNFIDLHFIQTVEKRAINGGYAWLFVLCLLYQLRFFLQLPVFTSMLAVNALLLPDVCAKHHPEMRAWQCVSIGLARAVSQLAISLLLVAGLEIRARRIWMLGQLAPAPAPAAGRSLEGRPGAHPPRVQASG